MLVLNLHSLDLSAMLLFQIFYVYLMLTQKLIHVVSISFLYSLKSHIALLFSCNKSTDT